MAEKSGWDKVARWAGIGNNREMEQEMESNDQMVEELNGEVLDPESNAGTRGVTEAGQEGSDVQPDGGSYAEVAQLKGERDMLMDRLARLQAEFDNFRKREAKERQDTRDYTVVSTVEPFLGVMDNFQLALKANGTAEQLRGGVELILKQMEDALKGLNVQPVESVGAMFDPRVHEALGSIETAEFPDHQVMEEIRRGYKIREKLLRPALVRIASNPAQVSE
ncbi:nucleotide exchange factor GrpE [Granulicella sibirica]|uniref:Protein GrpE n=1 Tax=Granulicella sibirica TaxID=2479048 RepID=A0A4Q0T2G5_9BACT|nr:nucleotide exchange factor GrpE [Granulicella sibirica]RXH57032.1 Heat shock protein GrpE [Granulicella sibirica]